MYNLIVVDDEKIMRDGLCRQIDWASMGFLIAGQFEDGREAIEYIEDNEVDAVLADIKMTEVSGLDLAYFIKERDLPIKVVILSGYKDFNYARRAIDCGVTHYMLKPISMNQVRTVFGAVKSELDREEDIRRKADKKHQRNIELMDMLREQFFTDIIFGVLRDESEILRRCKLIDIGGAGETNECCYFEISLDDYARFLREDWICGEEELCDAVAKRITGSKSGVSYYIYKKKNGLLHGIAMKTQSPQLEEAFRAAVTRYLSTAIAGVKVEVGIDARQTANRFFHTITDLALYTSSIVTDRGQNRKSSIARIENREGQSEASLQDVINKIRYFINENYNTDVTLKDVGDQVYLSPAYISRLFKERTGMNFSDYLTATRMEKAKEFLADFSLKVYQISEMVGYRSVKYFFKIFKRYEGSTPMEYRNRLKS